MSASNLSPLLATPAETFRREGDTQTADAQRQQGDAAPTRTLTGDDIDQIRDARRRGLRLDGQGRHDMAEPLLRQALAIAGAAVRPDSHIIAEHLGELARCRLNGGHHAAALRDDQQLLRMTAQALGADDERTDSVRRLVDHSRKCLRDVMGSRHLQQQMVRMLRHARDHHRVETEDPVERLRRIADRLKARGRTALAVRLCTCWMAKRLERVDPDDALVLIDMRHHALSLQACGHWDSAADVHRSLDAMQNKRTARVGDSQALAQALRDWQRCLAHLGRRRSATEPSALADAVDQGQQRGV